MSAARKAIAGSDAWVSLSRAAVMLGVTRQTVLGRIVKGELVAQHVAGRTVVSRASVESRIPRPEPVSA